MSTTISSLPFSLPLRQNSRVTLFNPPSSPNPSQSSVTFPKKKWRLLWFRHGNTSSKTDGSELNEDKLSEDLVKLEGVQSKDLKKDWLATILTHSLNYWLRGTSNLLRRRRHREEEVKRKEWSSSVPPTLAAIVTRENEQRSEGRMRRLGYSLQIWKRVVQQRSEGAWGLLLTRRGMTAMVGGAGTGVGCCYLSAGSGGGAGVGGGVGMNGDGGVGGGVSMSSGGGVVGRVGMSNEVNMSGGVGMGVCARSAFAEEEDGVVVEEEGGGKRWTGG
ncbi:hypothetical protein D0Y65_054314 [Glycine soja]|uniref:Uncharacterized protein n=1 Tax=Glycine soja TaxID=3848 RepID=A0A445F5Y6_GLYSO|nr:hypothetical protein D0Y65_054314 [Glycine soja]